MFFWEIARDYTIKNVKIGLNVSMLSSYWLKRFDVFCVWYKMFKEPEFQLVD